LFIEQQISIIRIISEGSCDTETWSNDAENSVYHVGINHILKCIQIENGYFKLIYISQYYCFCCILGYK